MPKPEGANMADALGKLLKKNRYSVLYPFREKLQVGTIYKRTGSDIEVIACQDDCLPGMPVEAQKLKFPKKITSSEGILDVMAGLSKDIIKTDIEAALNLSRAKGTFLNFSTLEAEMVPSWHKLMKHVTNMADNVCYTYLSDYDLIHTVIRTKGFTLSLEDAKGGDIKATVFKLLTLGIQAHQEGTTIIRLESESPYYIGFKAYKGKKLLDAVKKRKGTIFTGMTTIFIRMLDIFLETKPEIEQDVESIDHFGLWK